MGGMRFVVIGALRWPTWEVHGLSQPWWNESTVTFASANETPVRLCRGDDDDVRHTVPEKGLEPSHHKAQEPKSCVSTNSTTPA